jgi:hypothetical protein
LHGGLAATNGELQVLQPGLQQLQPVTVAASANARPVISLRIIMFASP